MKQTAVNVLLQLLENNRYLNHVIPDDIIQAATEVEQFRLIKAWAMGAEGKTIEEFNKEFKSE